MRRLFAVCLLVLMSLQLSWAAVGAYCQHEASLSAQHFGHHAHQHTAGSDDSSSDISQQAKGPHADCGLCHVGASLIAPGELSLQVYKLGTPPHAVNRGFLPDSPPSQPERPKWAHRA